MKSIDLPVESIWKASQRRGQDYNTYADGCHSITVAVHQIVSARLPRVHEESGVFTRNEHGEEIAIGPVIVHLNNGDVLHVDMDLDEFKKQVWDENKGIVL